MLSSQDWKLRPEWVLHTKSVYAAARAHLLRRATPTLPEPRSFESDAAGIVREIIMLESLPATESTWFEWTTQKIGYVYELAVFTEAHDAVIDSVRIGTWQVPLSPKTTERVSWTKGLLVIPKTTIRITVKCRQGFRMEGQLHMGWLAN